MIRPLPLLVILLIISCDSLAQAQAQAQNSKYASQKFSADTIRNNIADITRELGLKHPGFYRYNSKPDFTAYIDSVKSTVTDSLTEMESYLKFKPIITKIGCLHTGITLPKEYTEFLNQQPNLFPFRLYFSEGKSYIVKNFSSESSILPGDEIVSINGQSMDKIVATLLPLIPSDGYNLTMKYRALYYQFPTWYRLIDLTQDFSFVIKKNNSETTYQVKGVKFQEIAGNGFLIEPTREKQLEFKIENGTGFLSIHSFAKSAIKRGGQDFKDFIHDIFVELKKNKIKNLIVDLRDNTGGSDANAAYFASYFFDTPFQYWDRIEVTEPIAKEIKGVAKVFYRKPLKQDSIWLWQKGRHARDFDFYETQQPAKNNFKGRAYILINGFCMSSCADVAAILSYNSKAIFIGQETGGGYQGNTSGMMPGTTVEPFNFRLSVPLQKYVNAVDPVKNIGRGTIPDHIINPTIWEIIEGKDAELGFAIEQVKKSAD